MPLQPQYYALEGMKELFSTIELIRERFNPNLRLLGILPVLVDGRIRVSRDLLGQIRGYFGDRVLQTMVRVSGKIVEASIAGQPVCLYAHESAGSRDYAGATEEILERIRSNVPASSGETNGTQAGSAG